MAMEQLDRDTIAAALEKRGTRVYVYDSIDSTNDECKRRLAAGERQFAVLAEEQTGGRGRSGKSFYSPGGTGLYMSLVLHPEGTLEDVVDATTWAAVCAVEEIRRLSGRPCGIKWVNDVYLEGKKVGGILVEAVPGKKPGELSGLVIGLGLNLLPSRVPPELEDIVGFIGCDGIRNRLAAGILERLLDFCPGDRSYMERYREYSIVLGRPVSYVRFGCQRQGVAVGVDDRGALMVETREGIELLHSGEISLARW